MPDDIFRIVVTVAVILACIAFLVQAFVVVALYRLIRKTQETIAPVLEQSELITKRALPLIAKLEPLVDVTSAALKKAGPVLEKAGPVVERATALLTKAEQILEDSRPRIQEIATEGVAIAKTGREQAERLGNLLHDAGERARTRLEQIDRSVDNTVEQVEQIGDAVKRAALRPVREVNGIAAGVSAAVSTLVHGSRRPSVDHATQDEEMFI
jgi:methyl-accepting chemotaxis protein